MSKPHKACIFCELRRPMSKQHIFPDKLGRLLGPKALSHTIYRAMDKIDFKDVDDFDQIDLSPRPMSARKAQGDLRVKKLRRVCKVCNSGWMREAEHDAIELLEPVILGGSRSFNRDDQAKIALLIALIVVMIDVNQELPAISRDDRRHIFKERTVPKNWHIIIARANYTNIIFHEHMEAFEKDNVRQVKHGSVGMMLGGFFAQSVTSNALDGLPHMGPNTAGLLQERFLVIHPQTNVAHLAHARRVEPKDIRYLVENPNGIEVDSFD